MYVELVEPFVGKCGPMIRQEIEKGAIRKFAQATFETDPIYYDEEYAKSTKYGKIIAPPAFGRSLKFGDIPGFDLPRRGRVHAEQEYIYYRPICAGDVVYCQNKIIKTYEKEGRSGHMLFVVFEHAVYDENKEPYCIGYNTTLFKEDVLTNPKFKNTEADLSSGPEWNVDIEKVDVDNIKVGDKIGPIEFPPITKTKIAQWGGATGDYNPIHFEDAAAEAAGLPSVIAHGMISVALAGNVVNRWLSGAGEMNGIKIRFVSPTLPGDVIKMTAEITSVECEESIKKIECNIIAINQREQKVINASAVMSIPLKA